MRKSIITIITVFLVLLVANVYAGTKILYTSDPFGLGTMVPVEYETQFHVLEHDLDLYFDAVTPRFNNLYILEDYNFEWGNEIYTVNGVALTRLGRVTHIIIQLSYPEEEAIEGEEEVIEGEEETPVR